MRQKKQSYKLQLQREENLQKGRRNRGETGASTEAEPGASKSGNSSTREDIILQLEKLVSEGRELLRDKKKTNSNQAKRIKRARERCKSLTETNSKLRRSLKMRTIRSKQRGNKTNSRKEIPNVILLKDKGGIRADIRSTVRQLVAIGVPEVNVYKVLCICAEGFGISLEGRISARSAGRIVQEGGLAAQVQVVDEIHSNGVSGHTLSSDGTTIRHRNFESRHVTLPVPSYTNPQAPKSNATRMLGLSTAVNHKSETQLQGLKSVLETCYKLYNSSPLGKASPASIREFARFLMGLGSDHAEDQKKLARLLEQWKEIEAKYHKGQQYLQSLSTQALIPLIIEAARAKMKAVGGSGVWEGLSDEERQKYDDEAMEDVCKKFGEQAWAALSEDEREASAIFIWAGCCMHKELNSVKGGAQEMTMYWRKEGNGPGPQQLMNRDKEAGAIALAEMAAAFEGEIPDTTDATGTADKPASPSENAAVKLTSLAGALFKHKDPKKGQQETFKMYLENHVGYKIAFPDTSNTRFQSHCNAAAVLIVHYDAILQFLEFVRLKKDNHTFNHMELNVYRGLQDKPTITELCVLALYCEVLSKAYMKMIRLGGADRVNALDLAELHAKVKAFCASVVDNPDLVLTFDAGAYQTGTLDGKVWDSPDVIYAIAKLAPTLPHLRGCTKAFFAGALAVWTRLTSEFREEGPLHRLTAEQRSTIFINATNDHNEGVLGSARIMSRNAPTMGVTKMNSKLMYGRNDTENYIKAKLNDPASHQFLKRAQRERESAGIDRKQREEEIRYEKEQVAAKKKKLDDAARAKQEKADKLTEDLNKLTPALNLEALRADGRRILGGKKLTIPEIRLQLEWHRRIDFAKQMLDAKLLGSGTKRGELLTHLITAVELYNKRMSNGGTVALPGTLQHRPTFNSQDPSQDIPVMTWDEEEDMDIC